MESISRKTIKSGNASAVVLPKAWLDKRVRVELADKTPEIILSDVLEIVKSSMDVSDIMGIYLAGSYARGEQTNASDVDILIISGKTDRESIKKDNYEIMIISLELLSYKLNENLLPIGPMLHEAVPLLNKNLLKEIKITVNKKNVQWYLETTKDRLNIIKSSIDRIEKIKPDGKLSDIIAYSLILRLRTLYMIDCLKNNRRYHGYEFIRLIKKISGSLMAYDRYVYAKNNQDNQRELSLEEGKRLYSYLGDYLQKITRLINQKHNI